MDNAGLLMLVVVGFALTGATVNKNCNLVNEHRYETKITVNVNHDYYPPNRSNKPTNNISISSYRAIIDTPLKQPIFTKTEINMQFRSPLY
jgi:hypothetical protein